MAKKATIVRYLHTHSWGSECTALGGRRYHINRETGQLHRVMSNGMVHPKPGVANSQDVTFFERLPDTFTIPPTKNVAPKPPAPPSADPAGDDSGESSPASDPGENGDDSGGEGDNFDDNPGIDHPDFLSILDGSVAVLEEGLASGIYDEGLQKLLDAEEAGKTRKGAVEAIQNRMEEIEGD